MQNWWKLPSAFLQTRRAIGLLSQNMATQRLWLHRDFNNPIVSSGASLVLFNKERRCCSLCPEELDATAFDIIAHERENDKDNHIVSTRAFAYKQAPTQGVLEASVQQRILY
jgi:hypothetical protein